MSNLPEIFDHITNGFRNTYGLVSDASYAHRNGKEARKAEGEVINTITTEELEKIKAFAREDLTDTMIRCLIRSYSSLNDIDPDTDLYRYVKNMVRDQAFAYEQLGRQFDRIAGIDRRTKKKKDYVEYITLDDDDYDNF